MMIPTTNAVVRTRPIDCRSKDSVYNHRVGARRPNPWTEGVSGQAAFADLSPLVVD
jgi:hypothetical protein